MNRIEVSQLLSVYSLRCWHERFGVAQVLEQVDQLRSGSVMPKGYDATRPRVGYHPIPIELGGAALR